MDSNREDKVRIKACISVKSNKGKSTVCVVPEEDLGKHIITVDSGEEIKSFKKTDEVIKWLKKQGVSREERERVIEFLNYNLRPAEMLYDLSEKEGRITPIGGLSFKKEKLRL